MYKKIKNQESKLQAISVNCKIYKIKIKYKYYFNNNIYE